jgi:hypothetical protein
MCGNILRCIKGAHYLCPGKTDFGKSVNGLSGIVQQEMKRNPYEREREREMFVFCLGGKR